MVAQLRLIALVASALGSVACGDSDAGISEFVGRFAYSDGKVTATCGGLSPSQPLAGVEVEIEARGGDQVLFVAGPRCEVLASVADSTAKTQGEVRCALGFDQTLADGTFRLFQLQARDGMLVHRASGVASVVLPSDIDADEPEPDPHLECESFTLAGTLRRRSAP